MFDKVGTDRSWSGRGRMGVTTSSKPLDNGDLSLTLQGWQYHIAQPDGLPVRFGRAEVLSTRHNA